MLTLLGIGALIAVVVILYLLCPEQHPDGSIDINEADYLKALCRSLMGGARL